MCDFSTIHFYWGTGHMKYLCIIPVLFIVFGCAAGRHAATSGGEVYGGEVTIAGSTETVTMTLHTDKTAQMERSSSCTGTWERDAGGYLTVTLTKRDGVTINEIYVFIAENDSVTVLEHRVDGMALGSKAERFTLNKQ